MHAVAAEQQATSLTRTMRVGDELSLDNGRVVIRMEAIAGRRAKVNFQMEREVLVDKPPKKPPK